MEKIISLESIRLHPLARYPQREIGFEFFIHLHNWDEPQVAKSAD